MRHIKILLGLSSIAVSLSAKGQDHDFGVYPQPELTPEVIELREGIRKWKPTAARATVELPVAVDNSTNRYFPAVFSQVGGSCAQAAGMRYLFSYEMNRLLDRDAGASQKHVYSYFYPWNFLNDGKDMGGFAEQGLKLTQTAGAASLDIFPEQTSIYSFNWMSGYDKYYEAMHYRTKELLSFDSRTPEDLEVIKRYLYDGGDGSEHGGIVTFSANSSNWTIDNYYNGPSATGYSSLLTKLATMGAHAMTIAGYDDIVEFTDTDGVTHYGAFIVVNSYGQYYHDRGRYYLPYYFFLQEQRQSNILGYDLTGVVPEYHEPKIVFRVGLDYTSRNDIGIALGAADRPYTESPAFTVDLPIVQYQGGDYPMQGQYGSSSIELAFNFTDHMDRIANYEEPKYFLKITKRDNGEVGTGKITHFSVLDYRNGSTPLRYVCTDINNTELLRGVNYFSIATTAVKYTSASVIRWLSASGNPDPATYAVKIADGKYAKMQVTGYDRQSNKMSIRYLYQPDGSTNLDE